MKDRFFLIYYTVGIPTGYVTGSMTYKTENGQFFNCYKVQSQVLDGIEGGKNFVINGYNEMTKRDFLDYSK